MLLTAGYLIRIFFEKIGDAELFGYRRDLGVHFAVWLAREYEGKIDIVLNGECVEQVEILKHEAEVVAAEGCDIGFLYGRKILSVKHDAARSGLVKCGENIQQRCFARAGFAHYGDVFAGCNAEIYVFQRFDLIAAEAGDIDLFKSPDIKNVIHLLFSPFCFPHCHGGMRCVNTEFFLRINYTEKGNAGQ